MLGPVLFVVLCFSLYKQISQQSDLEQRFNQIKYSWLQPGFWVALLLFFVNWGIEAWKWRMQLVPLEKISFITAFKSVMAGCSITMLTPNRIGEFGGRILYVQEQHRLKAITLTILGSISQFLVTVLMGTIGLIVMKYFSGSDSEAFKVIPSFFSNTLMVTSVLVTGFTFMLYLQIGWLIRLLDRIKFLSKALKYVRLLEQFSKKQLLRILSLSVLRYMVFILQYMLLLDVMGVEISYQLSFWLLTIFYLLMAIAPTIGFAELPIRATASVELFKLFSQNVVGIQAAALAIFIINLVIPAIIGSILIIGIKITKEDE